MSIANDLNDAMVASGDTFPRLTVFAEHIPR